MPTSNNHIVINPSCIFLVIFHILHMEYMHFKLKQVTKLNVIYKYMKNSSIDTKSCFFGNIELLDRSKKIKLTCNQGFQDMLYTLT
jgi:hypothetical protein